MLVIDPAECIDAAVRARCRCRRSRRPRASPPRIRAFIEINAAWPDGPEAVDELVAAHQAQ